MAVRSKKAKDSKKAVRKTAGRAGIRKSSAKKRSGSTKTVRKVAKKAVKKKVVKSSAKAVKKAVGKKPAAKKAVKKPVKKKVAKKPSVKKAAAKKSVAKKPAVKRAAKKPAAKKTSVQKTAEKPSVKKGIKKKPVVSKAKAAAQSKVRKPAKASPKTVTAKRVKPAAKKTKKLLKKDLEFFRKLLMTLREKVAGNVTFLSADGLKPVESSEEDPDTTDFDLTLNLAGNEQNILYEIDEALQRIDQGAYGICEQTGEPIGRDRLKALPYARLSLEAQSQNERGKVRPNVARLFM